MWWLLTSCLLFESAGIDFPEDLCCDTGEEELLDADGDGVTTLGGDCDDQNPNIFLGAPELCDGLDNNCDGLTDQSFAMEINLEQHYFDSDADGYGQNTPFYVCPDTMRWSENNTDCNDGEASVFPGADEICDGLDNSCNGLIDDADPLVLASFKFVDADGDGFGNGSQIQQTCATEGFALIEGDCNDLDPLINPGVLEISMDLVDQDCDGLDVQDYSECGSQVDECSEVIAINSLVIPFQRVEPGTDPLGQYEILYPFAMMSTEMTQVVYESLGFMNYSYFQGNNSGQLPVDMVTWHEAAQAANALTAYVNLNYDVSFSDCYVCDVEFCSAAPEELHCTGYRLATNAEWEYASRAGTLSDFSMGGNGNGSTVADITSCYVSGGQFQETSRQNLTDYAWYCANTSSSDFPYGSTQIVATKSPNAWGFYDLQGNVSEWVYDTDLGFGYGNAGYLSYLSESPVGLMRGGGFYDPPAQLSNAFVFEAMDRQAVQGQVGIRLVRRLEY